MGDKSVFMQSVAQLHILLIKMRRNVKKTTLKFSYELNVTRMYHLGWVAQGKEEILKIPKPKHHELNLFKQSEIL